MVYLDCKTADLSLKPGRSTLFAPVRRRRLPRMVVTWAVRLVRDMTCDKGIEREMLRWI